MIQKTKKNTAVSLKKSLNEIRECLNESIPNISDKELVGVKFSRLGEHYRIEDAPIPPSDTIGLQLEKSFNDFMSNLNINYGGVKIEGSMFLGTKSDMFMLGYNNYERRGKKITKNGYSIDGSL
jgi:hypothetical protein